MFNCCPGKLVVAEKLQICHKEPAYGGRRSTCAKIVVEQPAIDAGADKARKRGANNDESVVVGSSQSPGQPGASEETNESNSTASIKKCVSSPCSLLSQETQTPVGPTPSDDDCRASSSDSSRVSQRSTCDLDGADIAVRAMLAQNEVIYAPTISNHGSELVPTVNETKKNKQPATGLATRRNFGTKGNQPLSIQTQLSYEPAEPKKKSLRWIKDISEAYEIGREVMPSCHKGMRITLAKRVADGEEFVVKVRFKSERAGRKHRKAAWLCGAEFMLNLPPRCNIARVLDILEDPLGYYVVMEKVSGRDLHESISGIQALQLPEVKEILCQILRALVDLHKEKRIHRDLKLENVMFDRTPLPANSQVKTGRSGGSSPTSPVSVKIIDFDTLEEYEPKTPKLARDVLGTNQYIAQEAYDGQFSPASDIFAAGVICYRLVTGRFPFRSDIFDDKPGENWVGSPKMREIRARVCDFKIKWSYRVFQEEPDCPKLLQRMLNVDPQDRPTAKEALAHPWLAAQRNSRRSRSERRQ